MPSVPTDGTEPIPRAPGHVLGSGASWVALVRLGRIPGHGRGANGHSARKLSAESLFEGGPIAETIKIG